MEIHVQLWGSDAVSDTDFASRVIEITFVSEWEGKIQCQLIRSIFNIASARSFNKRIDPGFHCISGKWSSKLVILTYNIHDITMISY